MSVYTEQRLRLHKERMKKRQNQPKEKQSMPVAPCVYIVKKEPVVLDGLVSSSTSSVNCSIALPQSHGFVFEDIFVYLNEKGETVVTSKRADKLIRSAQQRSSNGSTLGWVWKAVIASGVFGVLASGAIYFA